MTYTLTVQPGARRLPAFPGETVLSALGREGLLPQAPCGGRGSCGKCRVTVEGREVLACQTPVDRDLTVTLAGSGESRVLTQGEGIPIPVDGDLPGNLLAIDLGTTTVVCSLLDRQGRELATASGLNPQGVYGADVVSRIRGALSGKQEALCQAVRRGLASLIRQACRDARVEPDTVRRIALVGNPCMQQLLMDISPENLARVPFAPALRELRWVPAGEFFPVCPQAEFLVVPDLSGYVGSDTLGCVLAAGMHLQEEPVLLVDIGTNGEMVLGNRHRMVACAAAAGPALEGASIRCGMGAAVGAIDRVAWVDGMPRVRVIGGGEARGICGSGLIDAVAGMRKQGILNRRGRILSGWREFEGERAFFLTEKICLTQSDIRQVQLAKAAIAAGIRLMLAQLELEGRELRQVLLAGAFGSYLDPENACAIGLLPPELRGRIRPVGNAAGRGAKLLVCSRDQRKAAAELSGTVECLELASLPGFPKLFGRETAFPGEDS